MLLVVGGEFLLTSVHEPPPSWIIAGTVTNSVITPTPLLTNAMDTCHSSHLRNTFPFPWTGNSAVDNKERSIVNVRFSGHVHSLLNVVLLHNNDINDGL